MNHLDAKKALAGMFQCFNAGGDEKDRLTKLDCYWVVLKDLEPCFIVEACEYAACGKCGDGRFLPSAGELYQLAVEFRVRELERKRQSIPRISAPVDEIENGSRQRIIDGWQKLLADLKNGVPIDPDKATKDVFDGIRDRAEHPHKPVAEATSQQFETHPLTEADWPAIRIEIRKIVEKRGIPEFAAQIEWRKFRAWFMGLGPTQKRWWVEWPEWLDRAMANGELALPPKSRAEYD